FGKLDFLAFDGLAVGYDLPCALQVLNADEIVAVDDGDLVSFKPQGLNWLNELLILDDGRTGRMVGKENPIHHKVPVMNFLAKVTPIGHILLAVLVLGFQALIKLARY